MKFPLSLPLLLALAASALLARDLQKKPAPPTPAATPPSPVVPVEPEPVRHTMADCHLHLVDFLQRTDGATAALAAMTKSGVTDAIVSGMPLVKQWSESDPRQPQYYLEDDARCYWYSATDMLVAREIQALPETDRKHFHPIICGFNGADRNAVDHVRRMIEWNPGFWLGIGEVMTRHDDLSALTYGETARANNQSLHRIYELAAELDLPVFVHSNISSVWKREPIYLHEFEEAVQQHPKTKFVWCHAGISRRLDVPTLAQEIERMLATYPNVSMDISWVLFDTYLVKDGKPVADWIALFEKYPQRFLIGSDKVGRFHDYAPVMQRYYLLLDAMKPETARRIAHDNLLAILPRQGAVLKPAVTPEVQLQVPVKTR
ncbi:amidohydrolase family protein [Prosthecobacter sp.]|uniref:amidohydrolase family protein n=1 Tax=Prosthecobacter sp. TaxID=1965333 RepID=UPI003783CDEC